MSKLTKFLLVIGVALPVWVFVFYHVYTGYRMPRAMGYIHDGRIGDFDPRQVLSKAEQDPRAFETDEMRLLLGTSREVYRDVVGGGVLYGVLSFPFAYILFKLSRVLHRSIVAARGAGVETGDQ